MIAPIKRAHLIVEDSTDRLEDVEQAANSAAWQECYLAMLPRIRRQARRSFAALPAQLREEAVEEIVANTFVAYAALVRNGKEEFAYTTALTRFAVAQYHCGRRVGVRVNKRDVLSDKRRNAGTCQRLALGLDSSGAWDEVLVDRGCFTPADAAATRMDFASWLASLKERDRRLVETLARGETTRGAAKLFKISAGRVSQLRRAFYECWRQFQGELSPIKA
jgi:hypothetical protein